MCRMPAPAVIHCVAPVLDHPATTVRILVQERAVDHVGDGLESAMRMPRGALRLTRGVVDLAHLVHVDKRVEVLQSDAGEGADYREPFALEPPRAGRYRPDGALGVAERCWVQAWQRQSSPR